MAYSAEPSPRSFFADVHSEHSFNSNWKSSTSPVLTEMTKPTPILAVYPRLDHIPS